MIHVRHFLRPFALCLGFVLGCTGTGMAGCGSDDPPPATDSSLPGIYELTLYESSTTGCEDLSSILETAGGWLVLFALPEEDTNEAVMVGTLCSSLENCRQRVSPTPQAVNFAFSSGNDTSGWRGYGVADQGMVGEQCAVELQEHTLTSTGSETVQIDTRQLGTLFDGEFDPENNQVSCTARQAIESVTNLTPCNARFLLEARLQESL